MRESRKGIKISLEIGTKLVTKKSIEAKKIIMKNTKALEKCYVFYGMTDTMGRMHSDAQFAGLSSVPARVEMKEFLGMGNNPMVGATVVVAVSVAEALNK